MIKFSLACETGHEFDGWFGSSEDYETQQKRGLIACPVCDTTKVSKSLMTPSVSTTRKKESRNQAIAVATAHHAKTEMMAKLREIRDEITKNADNVGEKFPEEARKIHYGESERRAIYGEAGLQDVKELVDEGVEIAPMPVLPEDAN